MTRRTKTGLIFAALAPLALGACAETIECNKPKVYQQAQVGKKVEAPEGLDSLPEERELTIPNASPQAPPPPGACLDMPPTLQTGGDDANAD